MTSFARKPCSGSQWLTGKKMSLELVIRQWWFPLLSQRRCSDVGSNEEMKLHDIPQPSLCKFRCREPQHSRDSRGNNGFGVSNDMHWPRKGADNKGLTDNFHGKSRLPFSFPGRLADAPTGTDSTDSPRTRGVLLRLSKRIPSTGSKKPQDDCIPLPFHPLLIGGGLVVAFPHCPVERLSNGRDVLYDIDSMHISLSDRQSAVFSLLVQRANSAVIPREGGRPLLS